MAECSPVKWPTTSLTGCSDEPAPQDGTRSKASTLMIIMTYATDGNHWDLHDNEHASLISEQAPFVPSRKVRQVIETRQSIKAHSHPNDEDIVKETDLTSKASDRESWAKTAHKSETIPLTGPKYNLEYHGMTSSRWRINSICRLMQTTKQLYFWRARNSFQDITGRELEVSASAPNKTSIGRGGLNEPPFVDCIKIVAFSLSERHPNAVHARYEVETQFERSQLLCSTPLEVYKRCHAPMLGSGISVNSIRCGLRYKVRDHA